MLSTRHPPQNKGYITTESEGLEKDIPCKQRPRESRSSNTHINKIDFKTKAVKRDKEGHYIMIKGSIQEEDITIINIYAPNIGAPQYVQQMLKDLLQNTEIQKRFINSNPKQQSKWQWDHTYQYFP